MCPECGSDRMRLIEFDFGICSQTGYRDCGEYFQCSDCGATGDPEELSVDDRSILGETERSLTMGRPRSRGGHLNELLSFPGCIGQGRSARIGATLLMDWLACQGCSKHRIAQQRTEEQKRRTTNERSREVSDQYTG